MRSWKIIIVTITKNNERLDKFLNGGDGRKMDVLSPSANIFSVCILIA